MNANDEARLRLGLSARGPAQWRQAALVVGALLAAVSAIRATGAFAQSTPAPPQQVGAPAIAAQSARPTPPKAKPAAPRPAPLVANGCGSPGALGVSRVYEIDTTAGPRLGHQQYKDIDFLNDGEVVLTFDDGPLRPYTTPVLKALDAHCTKATFFMVGRMALSDPALVKDMAKRGHTIGSHTWSHQDLRKIGPSRAKGEMELGMSAVSRALGQPIAPFFRFPYLSAPQAMADYARSRQFGVFSIEVDATDYRTKDPAVVQRNVLSQLQDNRKGIILFHDIQASTAGAIKGLLDELKTRGFKVVHLVAKGSVTTLPEYDAMAAREMSRKSTLADADPLASRSVVWPVSGGKTAGLPANAAPNEILPWGTTAVRPEPIVPAPQAKPKPAPAPRRDDDDWATKLFRF